MRKGILLSLILSLLLLAAVPVLAQEATAAPHQTGDQAYVRIAHFSPETPAVNVLIDSQVTPFTNLEYKAATDWTAVPAGKHIINLVPSTTAGTDGNVESSALEVDLTAGTWTTLAATGSMTDGTFGLDAVQENFDEMRPKAKMRVFCRFWLRCCNRFSLVFGQVCHRHQLCHSRSLKGIDVGFRL